MSRLWLFALVFGLLGCGTQQTVPSFDADQAARETTDILLADPDTAAKAQQIADKDAALTHFQRANGISNEIAEASIKEWVLSHGGDFDWDLEEVKELCLVKKSER